MGEEIKNEDFKQNEIKDLMVNGIDLLNASTTDAQKKLVEMYGEIKGTQAMEMLKSAKLNGINLALSWDNQKSTAENIANFSGDLLQGVAIGAGLVLLSQSTPALAVAGGTMAIAYALKEFGFEFGDYTEDLYKYFEELVDNLTQTQQDQ